MKLPQPICYTEVEGGEWIKWKDRKAHNAVPGIRAHSIVFNNGRAFDMYNGWRETMRYDKKTGERK